MNCGGSGAAGVSCRGPPIRRYTCVQRRTHEPQLHGACIRRAHGLIAGNQARAAATPRPSAIPPAASSGTDTASVIAGKSVNKAAVPDCDRRPRYPGPQSPRSRRPASRAESTDPVCSQSLIPAAFNRCIQLVGSTRTGGGELPRGSNGGRARKPMPADTNGTVRPYSEVRRVYGS
jgi:hypothetical protein